MLIEIRVSGVHAIRGVVLVKEDRHAPNQGHVLLKDDSDQAFARTAQIQENGSFELPQVPPGTYTLTVDAQDVADPDGLDAQKEPVVLRDFAPAKVTVVVLNEDVVAPEILVEVTKEAAK